jgi:hypothetical protein
MNETRQTAIVDEEIEELDQKNTQESQQTPQELRDELFSQVKDALLEEDQIRLLKKFYIHANQHTDFDFDDMGLDFEESEAILKRCTTLKNKIIAHLEASLELQFFDVSFDTLHMMIVAFTSYKEHQFKIIIEVFEDSFDLEIAL